MMTEPQAQLVGSGLRKPFGVILLWFVITAVWAFATIVGKPYLDWLTRISAGIARGMINLSGIECVQDHISLYMPRNSYTICLSDTGLFWWPILVPVALSATRTVTIKYMLVPGLWLACLLLHSIFLTVRLVVAAASRPVANAVTDLCIWCVIGVLLLGGLWRITGDNGMQGRGVTQDDSMRSA